jgi:hypothetical protein
MVETKYGGRERRRFFRLEYPADDRPILRIGKNTFEVVDISERGIRFLNKRNVQFSDWVKGIVSFRDGVTMDFEGKIVWESGGKLGVHIIITPIPAERILQEQRRLIAKKKTT